MADWSSLTKQVKDASDIVAVVGSYLSLRPAGKVFKAVCPFHNDSRPSLQVDPHFQNFRCWSCGKFGSVFDFVMGMEKIEFREAFEMLARRAGIPLPSDSGEGSQRRTTLGRGQMGRQSLSRMPVGIFVAGGRSSAVSRRKTHHRRHGARSGISASPRPPAIGWPGKPRTRRSRSTSSSRSVCSANGRNGPGTTTGSANASCSPSGMFAARWSASAAGFCQLRLTRNLCAEVL